MQNPLWDYGWFARTSFRIDSDDDRPDTDVVREFISAPIYQRYFCESPDPWGVPIARHGSFPTKKIAKEWYRKTNSSELRTRIQRTIHDAQFDAPPEAEQMQAITTWVSGVESTRSTIFAMDAPEDETVRVDWAHVWFVFTEFICLNQAGTHLTVAVIGYD